jgi:hypothetical protein
MHSTVRQTDVHWQCTSTISHNVQVPYHTMYKYHITQCTSTISHNVQVPYHTIAKHLAEFVPLKEHWNDTGKTTLHLLRETNI